MTHTQTINLDDVSYQDNEHYHDEEMNINVMIPKNTFFKIHPEKCLEVSIAYHNKHYYLFSSDIASRYKGKLIKLSKAKIYQGITEEGDSFILPVVKPWPGYSSKWQATLTARVESAKTSYISMEIDDDIKCYVLVDEKRLTNRVQWPEVTFGEIITAAFPDDYYVEDDENPIIHELHRY